jgi:hypothetical protein
MAKKRIDPAAKQKRQRVIAGVGIVLLVGLLVFQVPKMMKLMSPKSNGTVAVAGAPTPQATPGVPVAPGAPVAPVPQGTLIEPPIAPAPGEGQLVSFELFESKDPFLQQVKLAGGQAEGEGEGTDPEAPPTTEPPALPPDVAPPATGSDPFPGSSGGNGSGSGGSGTAAATTATIAVNGVEESVTVGADFPADDPLFTLVRLTATSAEIAIAGGSYQDGAATVTLALGKTLTLMNTTDGARYEIRLVSVGAPAAEAEDS